MNSRIFELGLINKLDTIFDKLNVFVEGHVIISPALIDMAIMIAKFKDRIEIKINTINTDKLNEIETDILIIVAMAEFFKDNSVAILNKNVIDKIKNKTKEFDEDIDKFIEMLKREDII
jgi:hypothetical protein